MKLLWLFFFISRWYKFLLYFLNINFWIFHNLYMFDWLFFSALHMEESVADKITSSCSKIKSAVLRIMDYHSCVHNDSISGRNGFDFPPILQCICIDDSLNYNLIQMFEMHSYIWYIEQKNKNMLSTNLNALLIITRRINTLLYLKCHF